MIHLKVLYSPQSGKLLGGQAVGYDGVDKRIDVIATAIRHDATVYDLQEYELAYAPQFGSPRDPINIAGYVAGNNLRGISPSLDIFDLDEYLAEGALLLDVRNESDVADGIIREAYHIPLESLRDRIHELPNDRAVVTYCRVGQQGYIAQRILLQSDFNTINLSGGYDTFTNFFRQERKNKARNM